MTIPVRSLGVIEAAQKAARLLGKDMWRLWLLGFVYGAIIWLPVLLGKATTLATGDKLIENWQLYWSIPYEILLVMPVQAGLFLAVSRRIDGRPARVRDLFEAFRSCYGQAIIAGLVPVLITFAVPLISQAQNRVAKASAGVASRGIGVAITLGSCCGMIVLLVALLIGAVLFVFAMLALWDTPQSGLAAIRASVRVAWRHFWSVLGAGFLLCAAVVGVTSPGWIAYVVGTFALGTHVAQWIGIGALLLTFMAAAPLLFVWFDAMLIHLYRSWTGQPLVQPAAEVVPPMPAGPQGDAAPPAM